MVVSVYAMNRLRTFELIMETLWASVLAIAESDLEQAVCFLWTSFELPITSKLTLVFYVIIREILMIILLVESS